MSFGDLMDLLKLPPSMTALGAVMAVGLLFWRWLAQRESRDLKAIVDRDAESRVEAKALKQSLDDLGRRVDRAATRDELAAIERDLRTLQSDVRANWTELKGALAVVQAQLEGQRDILSRIDGYLREGGK